MAAAPRKMTPTAIACRQATTESGKAMLHTDVYLWDDEHQRQTGVTITIPGELLRTFGFRFWINQVTVGLLEPPGPQLSVEQVDQFYRSIGGDP